MFRKLSLFVSYTAVAGLLGALQGCTCSPATVDTVQPNSVSKAVFRSDREWYLRTTVIDVPYGTGASFIGAQSGLERVRWMITEDYLWAYRSYEYVTDSEIPSENMDNDGDGVPDDLYFGSPIAGFRIEKHFDIRRSYSRTTGEESNVIEENTEKPWYEREFMRVDWSSNAISELRAGGLDLTVSTYETDPNGELAPVFDCPGYSCDENEEINYIDFVQRVTVNPTSRRIAGFGSVPVCYFYGSQQFDCAPAEINVRYSILALDPTHEYEPVVYDDRWMETFGYFETMRLKYNREYGLTEENRVWYENHHNIWAEWFAKDAAGNVLVDADGNPVLMPYGDRDVHKIAYHLNNGYPSDLLQVTNDMVANWNEPFRDTVNDLRFWECMAETGDDVAGCDAARDPGLSVFVLCPNNPSLPTDPAECATPAYGARIGDLRFNHVYLVPNPQLASPFGYGPSAADPTTGEIISANAFVYGAVLETAATNAADIVALINGDISPDDYIAGENVEAWVEAANEGRSVESLIGTTAGTPVSKVYAAGAADAMDDKMSVDFVSSFGTTLDFDASSKANIMASIEDKMAEANALGIFGPGVGSEADVWQFIKDSGLDAPLWDEETILSAGYDPTVPFTEAIAAESSPVDIFDPAVRAELDAEKNWAGSMAIDLEEFVDPSILGLAMSYKNSGLDWEQVRQELKVAIYRGVMEHEIGHTLGLRHNFEASYDAMNYFPEYWDLRDDGNMGPRHIDPETPAEVSGRIREYEYSSVMDYHARFNSDTKGIGLYDRAAIKFGYGKMVEVMPGVPLNNRSLLGFVGIYNEVPVPAPIINYTDGTYLALHYTDYPSYFGDGTGTSLYNRIDVPFAYLAPEDPADAALVASGERNMDWTDSLILTRDIPGVVGSMGAPAVPYKFCGDEFAGALACQRYDEGADPVEVMNSITEGYWEYYVVANFHRGRYGLRPTGYIGRLEGRVFGPLTTWARYYMLWKYILGDSANDQAFFAADHGFGPFTIAVDSGFRMLEQIIHQPEPGTYCETSTVYGDPYFGLASYTPGLTCNTGDTRSLEMVTGKYYGSTWDFDAGYHWYDKYTRIGSYYDKVMALIALTQSSSSFIGRDTAIDSRSYTLGYNRLYRDQLSRILGTLMSYDPASYSPVMMSAGNPNELLLYPDPTDVTEAWPPSGMSGEPIASGAYWSIRYWAGLLGMGFLPLAFDNTFLDSSRIYVDGTGWTVTPPAGVEVVTFTDPFSGKTYHAWSYPARAKDGSTLLDENGDVVELGAGARMVRNAIKLLPFYNLTTALPGFDIGTPEGAAAQVAYFHDQIRFHVDNLERYMNMYEAYETRF